MQLFEHIITPDITAAYEVRRYEMIHPKLLESLERATDRGRLIATIRGLTQKGKPFDEALAEVEKQKDFYPVWEQAQFLLKEVIEVEIRNQSNVLASDAKISMSGSGFALTTDGYAFGMDAKPVQWRDEIKLGDLRPNSHMMARVWPDQSTLLSLDRPRFALVYGKDQLGEVYELQKFYGWDADLMSWFLQQPKWFRFGSVGGLLLLLLLIAMKLRKLGYIRFRASERL